MKAGRLKPVRFLVNGYVTCKLRNAYHAFSTFWSCFIWNIIEHKLEIIIILCNHQDSGDDGNDDGNDDGSDDAHRSVADGIDDGSEKRIVLLRVGIYKDSHC